MNLKHQLLCNYALTEEPRIFVETGTFNGDAVKAMLTSGHDFDMIFTIEANPKRAAAAARRFRAFKNVQCLFGDSAILVKEILDGLEESVLFWLDAHCSGVDGDEGNISTPLLAELSAVLGHRQDDILLIDDARFYDEGPEHLPGYPFMYEIRRMIHDARPGWDFEIKDDIVRCSL